jgi:hypothetical protein
MAGMFGMDPWSMYLQLNETEDFPNIGILYNRFRNGEWVWDLDLFLAVVCDSEGNYLVAMHELFPRREHYNLDGLAWC